MKTKNPPTVIGSRQVLHPVTFDAGPRIAELFYIRNGDKIEVSEIWKEAGHIVRVNIRPLRKGETWMNN